MSATIEQPQALPAINNQAAAVIHSALGLPDPTSIDLDRLSPAELATVSFALSSARAEAARKFTALCAVVDAMIAESKRRVRQAIRESGGSILPHDTLDVRLVAPPNQWEKRVDELLALKEHLKPEEFSQALMLKGVDVRDNPLAAEAAIAAGAKPIYEPHAGVLNRLRDEKHYGRNSEVGKIIERGLKQVQRGEPALVITPLEREVKPANT